MGWNVFMAVLLIGLLLWIISYARDRSYRAIQSETDTYNVRSYIALMRLKPLKSARDYYNMGCVYDYVYKQPRRAAQLYKVAAYKINYARPTGQDRFIAERLLNRIDVERQPLEHDEVRIAPYLQHVEQPALTLEPVWESDNNNVHDTAINDEIVQKFARIRSRVEYPLSFEEAEGVIFATDMPAGEQQNMEPARKAVDHIKTYNQMLNKAQVNEKDFLRYVTSDIMSSERRQVLMENLVNNLADCVADDGHVVCINGRVSRILNAYTDGETETFKSAQVWRNELIEAASRAKQAVLDGLTAADKKKYDEDTPGPVLDEIKTAILSKMQGAVVAAGAPADVQARVLESLESAV